MSTLEDVAAGKTKDPEAVEGLMSTYPIQAAQAPRRPSAVSSDISDGANISSISSLDDEASLQFFQSDPSFFVDEDSESESRNESYTTPEDASTIELPTELNSDKDLMDMAHHHCKLRNLHALIYENSVTRILERGLLVRHPSYDGRPQAIQPSEIQRIANAISDNNDKSTQTQSYRYIECYNILIRICDNLRLLQQKDFCSVNISLLCVKKRPEVAELLQVKLSNVVDLCSTMKRRLEKSFELSEDASLLDEFYLSPKILRGLEEMRFRKEHWKALSGLDVSFKNPDQNLSLDSSDSESYGQEDSEEHWKALSGRDVSFKNPDQNLSLDSSDSESYGPEDSEWHERESFVRTSTESLTPIFPKTSYHSNITPTPFSSTDLSSKGTRQEKIGSKLPPRPLSAPRDQFTKERTRVQQARRLFPGLGMRRGKEPLISTLLWDLSIDAHNLVPSFPPSSLVDPGSIAYTIFRSLDLMIISYAGAHALEPMLPGEQRDWRYLHINGRKISYDTEIQANKGAVILARRKPKCLDGFFGCQKLWVFHSDNNPNDQLSLYISAGPDEFADIWGPMWEVSTARDSAAVLRYDLEKGSIVPSQTPPGGWDVRLLPHEVPCHWMSNHDLRIWEMDNAPHEPPTILKNRRLVIGGSHQIHLIENTKVCHHDSARLKTDLSNSGYLRTPGTSKARRKTDAETFSATVGSGSPGVVFGYSRSTKIIAGRSWKESLLKRWIHEKTTRNPYTLLQYRGIEISQCTSHSRRIRLVDVLGTKTMMRWLSTINPVTISEAAVRIDQMLRSCPTQLVECYINDPAMRENIGDLVGACLNVLFETGCTAESATALSAFWMFANDEHLIGYPPKRFEWSGLVQDTDSSCAFVVLEEKCLIFCLGRGCQYPSGNSQRSDQFGSLFETRLIINDQIKLPEGLVLLRRNKSARWSVRYIEKGSFRIGDHGSLKVTKPMSDRHLLLRWSNEFSLISSGRGLAARILSSEPAKFHREYISVDAERNLAPICIFVAS
jgi:hypothetical protein